MNRTLALVACAFALTALPAVARDFVQDQAGMFSAGTVASLNERIGAFNAQTGKEIVVMTVPSLGGATVESAAETAFSQQSVNGVLIFIARDDRHDIMVPDRAGAQAGWFTPDVLRSIRTTMESQFRSEDYDGGITAAVDGVLNVYRAHLGGLRQPNASSAGAPLARSSNAVASGGFHISMFWWIIIIVVGFLILRSIMRGMSAPRYGPGVPPGAPGGMPAGGYGPGYGGYGGYGGGGGSFWSGLLGGLGGAWLGNEMFGNRGGAIGPADAGQTATQDGGGGWGGDSGGWQSDAGQADAGGASSGDWSGGGFGGDSGGGFGGGDFGGGGGDSGGGW